MSQLRQYLIQLSAAQVMNLFMQCFQGYYRDRTDGGRECRYFAAVYPAFRIAAYVMYSLTLGNTFYLDFMFLCAIVTVAIVFVSPYKDPYKKYNKLDIAMILSLGSVFGAFLFIVTVSDKSRDSNPLGYIFSCLFSFAPLLYFSAKFCLSVRCFFVYKLSAWQCMSCPPSRRQRGDYEDLSNIN